MTHKNDDPYVERITDDNGDELERGAADKPEPTAEHIDAVAHAIVRITSQDRAHVAALRILTSTDPAVHAAQAANLPTDVLRAALIERDGRDEWQLLFKQGGTSSVAGDPGTARQWMQPGDVMRRRRAAGPYETPWEPTP